MTNDEAIIRSLKNSYDKNWFVTTGSSEQLKPNTLHFIKGLTYLKNYILDKPIENIKNAHVVVHRDVAHFIDNEKCKHIMFYLVSDVTYVFGEVHNYIHNNNGFYMENQIDKTAVIHPTASLDTEGIHLYYYHTKGKSTKKQLKHISNVKVGHESTIGANTVIHKGVFNSTTIGDRVTIGSLVNIGHNCQIGNDTVITPGNVLAGRVKIGKYCWIGVNCSFKHGVEICDYVVIGQGTNVLKNITESGIYVGNPIRRIGNYTENWNF